MKKFLLAVATLVASMSVSAADIVYFSTDFSFLTDWAKAYVNEKGEVTGNTIETDNLSACAPQIVLPTINGQTAYAKLEAEGYTLIGTHAASKAERKVYEQVYLQDTYLKFGLTGYYSGIILPKLPVTPGKTLTIDFVWCPMRQASGTIDPTLLIVEIKNGDNSKQFKVPAATLEKGEKLRWIPVSITLEDVNVTSESDIIIRNCDEQWPVVDSAPALRWFLDDVKVYYKDSSVSTVGVDANAPAEYYNIGGVKVAEGNLVPGVYVKRQGGKTTKVLVK